MARPRSEDKRNAILAAATLLVAEQGLGASTADIARQAGVPHGSVFTYFSTKAELLNALYIEIKSDLTAAVLVQVPADADPKARFRHLWQNWTHWGVANPLKRRALAQLGVSDLVSEASRKAAFELAEPMVDLVRMVSARGALRDLPLRYVGALLEACATTTMEFMTEDPPGSESICEAGFEAVWRAVS